MRPVKRVVLLLRSWVAGSAPTLPPGRPSLGTRLPITPDRKLCVFCEIYPAFDPKGLATSDNRRTGMKSEVCIMARFIVKRPGLPPFPVYANSYREEDDHYLFEQMLDTLSVVDRVMIAPGTTIFRVDEE